MPKTTAVANGANDVERQAAQDANAIQDACNLVAIVGCWHGHLVALHRAGIGGDALINHPTSLAFVSSVASALKVLKYSMDCGLSPAILQSMKCWKHSQCAKVKIFKSPWANYATPVNIIITRSLP